MLSGSMTSHYYFNDAFTHGHKSSFMFKFSLTHPSLVEPEMGGLRGQAFGT